MKKDRKRQDQAQDIDPENTDVIEDAGTIERKTKRVSHKRHGWSDERIKHDHGEVGDNRAEDVQPETADAVATGKTHRKTKRLSHRRASWSDERIKHDHGRIGR